jgi:hypothetical protein
MIRAHDMAHAYRVDGVLWISVAFQFPPDARDRYSVQIGSTTFEIAHVYRTDNLLQLHNINFELEKILMEVGINVPYLLVNEHDTGNLKLADALTFHPSFFVPFFDFLRNAETHTYALGVYQRPVQLAVFTHVHNDSDMLTMWERHYANLVPHQHLYVIDHGSDRCPAFALHPGTQVVSIPRGAVDHINISQFCGYFQRFLLSQYRWVIHVDSDELLVHEQGVAALLEQLDDRGYGPIIQAGNAVELLDVTDGSQPLDPGLPLSLQRQVLNAAPGYRKPVLASEPTSWAVGFHAAFEHHRIASDPALWLVHVRYADLRLAARRELNWTDAPHSEASRLFTPQDHRRDTLDELRDKIARTFSNDRSTMPAWMRGTF